MINFTKRNRTSRRCGVFWRQRARPILRLTTSVWLFRISSNCKSDNKRSLSISHDNRRHWVRTPCSILETQADILAEIYNWFTEGFDTKDLQEAKALLEELSHE